MSLLRIDKLNLTLAGRKLLGHTIDLDIKPGNLIIVRGENGCGKSTLLRAIAGQQEFQGQITRNVSDDDLYYLPQLGNLQFMLPMTLNDVIELRPTKEKWQEYYQDFLTTEQSLRQWNVASGGERQRALLIQGFMQKAKLYLLDEPSNHLDQKGQKWLFQEIGRQLQQNAAFIVVCHDLDISSLPITQTLFMQRADS